MITSSKDRANHRLGITGAQEISKEFAPILRIVRPREVRRCTALSRAHLRRLQQQGRFPPFVRLSRSEQEGTTSG